MECTSNLALGLGYLRKRLQKSYRIYKNLFHFHSRFRQSDSSVARLFLNH
jgi:hypothetical protein